MVKKKYYIQLAGGLANLIFQMNLATYLYEKGYDVIIDISWLNKRKSKALNIAYEIFEYEKFKQKDLRFLRYFFMLFGKLKISKKDKMYTIFNYNFLVGYWQYDFFFRDTLIKKVSFPNTKYGCIHYRLGDYRFSKAHKIKDPDYFIEKLNLIEESYDEIFLCTNEPLCDEVSYLLNNIDNLILYKGNTKSTFQKLANASFIIGSDSTFSYCAHKFGKSKAYFEVILVE